MILIKIFTCWLKLRTPGLTLVTGCYCRYTKAVQLHFLTMKVLR